MKLSEDRILQISNDISEDMCKATRAELIEVVRFWRDEADRKTVALQSWRTKVLRTLLELELPS